MKTGVIATEETMGDYDADEVISVGSRSHMETVTANLYDVLREEVKAAVTNSYNVDRKSVV